MEEKSEVPPDKHRIAKKALAFDPERYRQHMANLNLSEEAQLELLAVVHRIMESFVDRAFGDDAVQLARIAEGSRETRRDRGARFVVSSDDPTQLNGETLADVFRLGGEGDSKERCEVHE